MKLKGHNLVNLTYLELAAIFKYVEALEEFKATIHSNITKEFKRYSDAEVIEYYVDQLFKDSEN